MPLTTEPMPASLARRVGAIIYDALAVTAIVMVVGLLCQLATGGHVTDGTQIAWWYQPLQGLVVAAYFLVSWTRGGQTLGMRPWRIRACTDQGAPLPVGRALVRLTVGALPLLGLGIFMLGTMRWALWAPVVGWALWLLPALVDPRRRALHDIASGSMLARLA
ncbi:RDD family protein [Pinirhizobacter sp.]|jgi:uncharacterized RDD family membrane protein YckC|uniref:RDD family protein n=1 Tax=Pinirhizobacter sp. TaxID=2950432 RepID=UPI002F42EFA5